MRLGLHHYQTLTHWASKFRLQTVSRLLFYKLPQIDHVTRVICGPRGSQLEIFVYFCNHPSKRERSLFVKVLQETNLSKAHGRKKITPW